MVPFLLLPHVTKYNTMFCIKNQLVLGIPFSIKYITINTPLIKLLFTQELFIIPTTTEIAKNVSKQTY